MHSSFAKSILHKNQESIRNCLNSHELHIQYLPSIIEKTHYCHVQMTQLMHFLFLLIVAIFESEKVRQDRSRNRIDICYQASNNSSTSN